VYFVDTWAISTWAKFVISSQYVKDGSHVYVVLGVPLLAVVASKAAFEATTRDSRFAKSRNPCASAGANATWTVFREGVNDAAGWFAEQALFGHRLSDVGVCSEGI